MTTFTPLTSFTALEESTAEDWARIMPQLDVTQSYVPDNVLTHKRDKDLDK